jgi:zinc transport system ATP-binding protein
VVTGSTAVCELVDVVVRRGTRPVLSSVNLRLQAGDVVSVSGTNGSGKTSLLRLLVGIGRASSGRVEHRARTVAYVPGLVEVPPISAARFQQGFRPHAGSVDEALEALGAQPMAGRACKQLSLGNFRKLLIAEAVAARCDLLVIDEALAALDENGVRGLDGLIVDAARAGTAVVVVEQGRYALVTPTRRYATVGGHLVERTDGGSDAPSTRLVLRGPVETRDEVMRFAAERGFVEDGAQ